MRPFLNFLSYNNAVPIAVSLLLLGGASAFAATNPDAVYSSAQQVVSIDNTYIVSKDLSAYSPRVEITGVTEDTDTYYIAYNFSTIDLKDSVWQDVTKGEMMSVSKADLGPYRDLGLYVTEQLKQKTDRELAYLKEVQGIEQKSVTQKVVATSYGGLIGKFLDNSTETLPGYTPVVTPPAPETQVASAASANGTPSGSTISGNNASLKIGLQLLGNNPARIALNASYIDLGAVLIDPHNTNVGIHAFQDGAEVASPSIDTSTTSAQTVEYRATDPGGAVIVVRRVILVGGAADPGGEISTAGNVTISASTPTPAPTPEPTPAPAPQPEQTPTETATQANVDTATSSASTDASSTASTTPATDTGSTASATTTASTTTSESAASTDAGNTAAASTTTETASATTTAQ